MAVQLERSRRRHMSPEDLQKELERLESAYADSPGDPDLLLRMADVHEKLRDWPAALDMVERALEYRRDSFELVSRRGDLRARVLKKQISRADKEGDQARAGELEKQLLELELEDFRERVRMHPGDAALRLQLGRRLMRLEQLDEALAEFQKANADPRVRRDALFHMAQCFQQKGFADLARKEYQHALEGVVQVDERAKEILYNLGDLAAAEQNGEEARSFYARIYEVDIGYRDVAAKMEEFR
jgi:tetratricopeptide (TPR) repeat protein